MDKNKVTPLPYNHYSIGQAAEYLGVSIKTLRRWDSEGRLVSTRNQLNQRLYNPHQLQAAKNGVYHSETNTFPSFHYLNISQAANYLSVSEKTLRRWEKAGKIISRRNDLNQRLYTKAELQQTKQRLEAERFLPQVARTSNTYWQSWPTLKTLLVGSGIAIVGLLLFLSNLSPSLPLNPESITYKSNPIPTQTANPVTSLTLVGNQDNILSFKDSNPISLSESDAPPTLASADQLNSSPADPIPNLETPLATQAASMLIKSIIIQYLQENQSGIVNQDIILSDLIRANLTDWVNLDASHDQLTTPTASTSTSLPPTDLDPLGDLAPTPTPLPSTPPSPIPQTNQNLIPAGTSELTVSYNSPLTPTAISITFMADYAHAIRYWITQNSTTFTLHLDQPVAFDTPFTWLAH